MKDAPFGFLIISFALCMCATGFLLGTVVTRKNLMANNTTTACVAAVSIPAGEQLVQNVAVTPQGTKIVSYTQKIQAQ
ncbi:MAG: hypothetical protein IKX14_04080 [Neisseriaceae bacterium]|nr:hypothetical protein [Neisseriaceae bacterium]